MAEHAPRPVFARIYARVADIGERRGAAEHRRKLLAGLSGRVIELGAGSGANFAHYPTTVSEVVAVEPERYLRERAQQAAADAPIAVSVVDGVSDRLPGEAGSFDAGVAALVLCTVPDQPSALAELYRVIRPGGELRFYEHVVGHGKFESRFQRLADATFWPHVAGGCHMARDTTAGIEQAGFQIETCERFPFSPALFLPPDPHILGIARRP
ncbi:MAG TPA: methyltransferase domain-containing protein [Solirubrobacteraceae bacterium]|nr:methyltransferase domain-containing protein [Solirubrobacteraceae bacterium]